LGIKKPVIKNGLPNNPAISENDFVLCTIGRLVKRKNLIELFEVIATLKDRISLKLVVIGDGLERAGLSKAAEDLEIQDKVILAGTVDDATKFQYLTRADIYVSTALHEGFGLVFLEAMECGLPIICYNRGGQNDFLINEKTGYLVELHDKQGFAEKIEQLFSNPRLRSTIGTFCSSHIRNYYIENCANLYIALFDEAIEAKKSCI
jgi:glycosyltransferase involved in cell wall biosynthesis